MSVTQKLGKGTLVKIIALVGALVLACLLYTSLTVESNHFGLSEEWVSE